MKPKLNKEYSHCDIEAYAEKNNLAFYEIVEKNMPGLCFIVTMDSNYDKLTSFVMTAYNLSRGAIYKCIFKS